MSESVNTLSLGLSQGTSLANKRKASVIEDGAEQMEPKRYKISPRATLDALSGLRISRERVLIPQTLDATAGGASASVQLAILLPAKEEHPEHPSTQGHFVALKQFRLDDDKGDTAGLAPLAHELSLLRNLEHKNIVRGLGFIENVAHGIAWIVLPWAPNGNLRDFVRSRASLWGKNIRHRLALIADVVCGLDYLHGQSEPICHGDLKSLNILVNEQQNAVITDFGSARILGEVWEARSETTRRNNSTTRQQGPQLEYSVSDGSITMTAPGYTVRWAAPEVLDGELPTLASDIWSLGWIYWEVLTGKFPFDDILKDQDVIIEVLGGELPEPQSALPRGTDPSFLALDSVDGLCTLMEMCWAMDPQSRPQCCDVMASLQNQFFYQSKNKSRDEKSVDSLVFLQAVSEMHLSEGRLGEAIQYIQELRRVARLTKQELTAITSQGLLDRCRRSTSGIETVHEEEAGISWNLALTFFADQLYQEAEGHANNAARLYTELGFETQALECDQFLAAIQDAMGSLLQPSYNKELPKLLLTHPERFRDPAPSVKDPIYECKKKRTEIVWFVAGALQCAPDPLTAEKIVSLIEKYHPGKIRRCKEAWDWSSEGTDTEFIEHVLSTLKAFEAHETFSGYWGLSKLDYLPPFPRKDLLCGYDNPSLGSIQPEEGDRFKFLVRSGLSKRRARDEKATSEKRLSEGRLGEGLKYIQEFRRIARLAKQELAAITSQGMLDRYRRSTSGVETVHEEEAGISWNLALTLFAGQLYQEAERHVINATRLYKELGFETQALECDQFLDAIQDAMGTPPQPPEGAARYNKDLPKLFLTCPRDSTGYQLPFAKAPIGFAKIRVEMVWFIAGALQCASPDPLAAESIVSLIEKHRPGSIRRCLEFYGWSEKWTNTEFTDYILSKHDAFEADETLRGYWRLGEVDFLPPFPSENHFAHGRTWSE